MKITDTLSDDAILAEFGQRIADRRIHQGLTQAALAEQAGVSKRTVERIESGASAQLGGVIRLFRVLGLLPALDQIIASGQPRPTDLLKRKGKLRQRASPRSTPASNSEPWSWDDGA